MLPCLFLPVTHTDEENEIPSSSKSISFFCCLHYFLVYKSKRAEQVNRKIKSKETSFQIARGFLLTGSLTIEGGRK